MLCSVGEDLGQKGVVDAVEVFENGLHGIVLVHGGDADHVGHAVGGVLQDQLGVFEAFRVGAEGGFELGGVFVGVGDGSGGGDVVALGHALAGELGPAVQELGVEIAAVFGFGDGGTLFQVGEGGGVEDKFGRAGGEGGAGGDAGEQDRSAHRRAE